MQRVVYNRRTLTGENIESNRTGGESPVENTGNYFIIEMKLENETMFYLLWRRGFEPAITEQVAEHCFMLLTSSRVFLLFMVRLTPLVGLAGRDLILC